MRLITRRPIYRVFPELDAYSDERCRRFVEAAKRTLAGWWMARVKQLLTLGLVLFLEIVLLGYVGALMQSATPFGVAEDVALPVALVAVLIPPPLAALVVGDLHLRNRLREVLRVRALCHACGYSLIGVVVSEAGVVVCPECGFSSTVDPALGELTRDDSGRTVYSPSES